MNKNTWLNRFHILFSANRQAARSFMRNAAFHKGSFICFCLIIALCTSLILTGFSITESFKRRNASGLISTDIHQLYVGFASTSEKTVPDFDKMQQFAASNSDYFKGVIPYLTADIDISYGRTHVAADAVGTNDTFLSFNNLSFKEGGFFNGFDIENGKKVIVLGNDIAEKLFPNDTAAGQIISCRAGNFTVIGTLSKNEKGFENTVFFPYTLMRQVFDTPVINRYIAVPENGRDIQAKSMMQDYLTDELKDVSAFSLYTQNDLIRRTNPVTASWLFVLWTAAAAAFLIIVLLLFIFLCNYFKKAKSEIELRFLAGAEPMQIFWQIVIEGKYNALAFTAAGIILGILSALLLEFVLKTPFALSFPALLVIFLAIPTIGVILGIFHAAKALRH